MIDQRVRVLMAALGFAGCSMPVVRALTCSKH